MDPTTLQTRDGVRLEAEIRMPDDTPRGSAVLCHPHPRHGGSKDHPLLWAIRNELAAAGSFAVVAFNFRGVMGSSGSYGGGRDELRDAAAAIGHAGTLAPEDAPLLLVGWSFGASVALRAAIDDPRVSALALVGLPLDPKDLELPQLPAAADLRALRRPTLLLTGEHDEYCPPDMLRAYASGFPRAEVSVVDGTDHYFWRREKDAAAVIAGFADRTLFG